MNLNPAALLAAVLYHANETRQVKIKLSDSGEEKIIQVPQVEIKKEGDALMCIMPLPLVTFFAGTPYNMHFATVNKPDTNEMLAVIGFEKGSKAPTLVAANGKPINTNSQFKKLFDSVFSGLREAPKP